jgi:hypothetical protein
MSAVRRQLRKLIPAALQQLSRAQRVLLGLVVALESVEAFGYFTLNNVFTLHLTNELGYTDLEAGALFGARGSITVIYAILVGPLIDYLGPVRALPIGFALQAVGRCIFAMALDRPSALLGVYGPMAIGHAMNGATLQIGVKRACASGGGAAESSGFALWYIALLIGISSCGWFIDLLTSYHPEGPYRQLAFFTSGTALLGCGVSLIFPCYFPEAAAAANVAQPRGGTVELPWLGGRWARLKQVICTARFARYVLFNVALLPGFAVQRNLDGGVYPKYMLRTFGPTVPKGAIYSICAVGSMGLIPLFQRLTEAAAHFETARPGILIMVLSAWCIPALGADRLLSSVVMMLIQAIGVPPLKAFEPPVLHTLPTPPRKENVRRCRR